MKNSTIMELHVLNYCKGEINDEVVYEGGSDACLYMTVKGSTTFCNILSYLTFVY